MKLLRTITRETLERYLDLAEVEGIEAALAAFEEDAEAEREAIEARIEDERTAAIDAEIDFEHDDSEWADRRRGYGQPDSIIRNEAGEILGWM